MNAIIRFYIQNRLTPKVFLLTWLVFPNARGSNRLGLQKSKFF